MRQKLVISRVLLAGVAGFIAAFPSAIFAFLLDLPLVLVGLTGFVAGCIVGGLVLKLLERLNSINYELERLPASAADYIKLVIENMRYRKIARQEVANELTDHFEQAIKDCKTEEEKQKVTEHLIDNFGDAGLLAVLLRRAKKRCRPLWRTVVARTLQTIAILIICLILYTAWFFTGKPVITTDYVAELNKLVRPSADDSFNAAPIYQKAIDALVEVNDIGMLLGLGFYDANDQQKERIRQWLTKNESALALVTEGSKLPYYWSQYGYDDTSMANARESIVSGIQLPRLAAFRRICYALRWRAWISAENGLYESALNDIETCYRLGRHNKGEKLLVEQLVGIAIEAVSLKTARLILDAHKIPSEILADFERRLQQLIDNDTFAINFQSEKLCLYDEIQRCFTESRLGPTHIYPRRILELTYVQNMSELDSMMRQSSIILQVFFRHPDKAETIAAANDFFKFLDEIMHKTPARLQAEKINTEAQNEKLIRKNLLFRVLMPGLVKIYIQAWRVKIDAEGTLTAVALVRYKQDKGDYPETLEKLVEAGYITRIPIDPFSDTPLSYKKTEQGPVLYSWGKNLIDDGGQAARDKKGRIIQWTDESDLIFWPAD